MLGMAYGISRAFGGIGIRLELRDADEVGMSWSNSRPMQWEVLTFHCHWILEGNGLHMRGQVARTKLYYSDSHPRFFQLLAPFLVRRTPLDPAVDRCQLDFQLLRLRKRLSRKQARNEQTKLIEFCENRQPLTTIDNQ